MNTKFPLNHTQIHKYASRFDISFLEAMQKKNQTFNSSLNYFCSMRFHSQNEWNDIDPTIRQMQLTHIKVRIGAFKFTWNASKLLR